MPVPNLRRGPLLLAVAALLAASPALAKPRPRPLAPGEVSGPKDRPTPNDSRYPAETTRPTGVLLRPLPGPGLRVLEESIDVRCRFGGGGCEIRQSFSLRQSGDATTVSIRFATPTWAISVEVDDVRQRPEWDEPPANPVPWTSTAKGIGPERGQPYTIPAAPSSRPTREGRIEVSFAPGITRKLTFVTHSVGGFDRVRRRRTQAEVAFAGTRRKDPFVYHHELLRPAAVGASAASSGAATPVTLRVPDGLVARANVPLRCTAEGKARICQGELPADTQYLRWSVSEKYRRPIGFSLGVGLAFDEHGVVDPLLRAALALRLRQQLDLLWLAVETDAHRRAALALAYELFLPFKAHTNEMGYSFELGAVLDVTPTVSPAVRLGVSFHYGLVQIGLRFDLYPGEFRHGGGPVFRGQLGLGIGL